AAPPLWCRELFGFLIGLSSSLDPRDPNACSLWESYTTSVKESYSHPYDHVTEEPCSDPRTSYRCSRHRITYKTAYRQAVKTEHRRRYHCCPGYYESGGRCVPHCSKECVHGRCVAPNRCQCEKGWRGDDCSSSCDDRHWGPDCQKECKCENGALCDPVRGVCQCPPGFIGRLCEDSCPAGTFGKGCQQRCKCGNGGSCNKATGECTCQKGFTGTFCAKTCKGSCQPRCPCQNEGRCKGNGVCACLAGWTGAICTEQCPEGRFGKNCSEECVCHNGAKCDPLTGRCQCREGFTGNRCNEECTAGTYGQDCKGVCNCANGARCFNIDGSCFCEPGFSGPQCRNRMCGPGNYGMHCEHKCLCEEKHTLSCHPMKGECTCQPGWAGLFCNETCPHGFYGDGCMEPCLCVNGGVCDSATGRCHCSPGFTGVHCESPCKTGTYGKNCSLECSCENFIDCSPVDGTCFCKEGWQGPDCSVPCADGTWGPGCNATCRCTNGAKCDPADGSCKCSAGWQGALCDQPCGMGSFGPGCLKKCDCIHGSGCQATSGKCHCLPGWTECSVCIDYFYYFDNGIGRQKKGSKFVPKNKSGLCRYSWTGKFLYKYCPGRIIQFCFQIQITSGTICHPVCNCGIICLPGPHCSDPCPEGLWGPHCNHSCSDHCPNSDTCLRKTGECVCRPGYWGAACQNSESGSDPRRDGRPLRLLQFSSCVSDSSERVGSVMVPLPPGERESWGAIGGFRRRQKDKQNNTPTVSFSTSRTVNSEYAVPDVPHSYHHYYSNPSYHTLSQNRPPLPHLPNTNNQLFCSVKNAARERRGLFGVETNATLPADWKHHESRKGSEVIRGAFGIDRSYSYSASLGKYYNKAELKDLVAASSSSLNSENPYATIKDLPGPPFCPPESSYMEMKAAVPRERAYTEISPPPFSMATLRREKAYTSPPAVVSERQSSLGHAPHDDPQSHYDLPVNSHIPGHYDLPPVRRPPSPRPAPRRAL
uniref:Platelet endothelial aggregation receptor 1 n=1 Tax=Poecilia formosa TaxID=48698 RepID=A0A096LPS9_POEFO